MATRETAQLILEVDARIATAQRAVNQLARTIQQDAAGMDNSLKRIEQSSERVGKSLGSISGRTRSGFTQLSFQIGDVSQQMALGVNASRIFAQQSGQVIQALQIMGGEGNKFLRFLGGPWGLALSTAAVILGPLAAKLFETKDEVGKLVDKMREQAAQAAKNRDADELWKHTIEGLTEAIKKRREEQEKGLQTDIQSEQDSLAQARADIAEARQKLNDAIKQQHDAEAARDAAQKSYQNTAEPKQLAAARQRLLDAQAKVDKLVAQVNTLQLTVFNAEAEERAAEAKIGQRQIEQKYDPAKKAADEYTKTLGDLNRQLSRNIIDQATYNKKLDEAKAKLEAAQEAAKNAQKNGVSQFKSSVIGAEGTGPNRLGSSAAGYGQFMPSTFLSYFNKLFPDKSQLTDAAKLEFRNVREVAVAVIDKATDDYVNVLKSAGQQITAANLYAVHLLGARDAKKLFAAAPGTDTSQLFSSAVLKGNPFLKGTAASARAAIGKRIGDSSSAVSSGSLAIDRELEEQAKKDLAQQIAFTEESAKLDQEILRARNDLLQGVNEQADAAEDAVREELDRRELGYDNDAAEKKITEADAEILKTKALQVAQEKIKAIEIDRQVKLIQQQSEDEQRTFQYKIDDLRFADEMAKTQAEHRKLQLDILDAVYERRRLELEANLKIAEQNKKQDEINRIKGELARLPIEKAHDQSRTLRSTQSPIDAYFADVPRNIDDANEAMQRLEVQGIDGAINALLELRHGFAAFRDAAIRALDDVIAQLLRMQLMKMAFNLFGAASGGAGGFDMAGMSVGFSGVPTDLGLPGYASGGIMEIGGRGGVDQNILSINGRPRARVSASERLAIIPRTPRISSPANSNGGDTFHVHVAAPNTGDPRRDRATSLQQAADIQRAIAGARMKGVAA